MSITDIKSIIYFLKKEHRNGIDFKKAKAKYIKEHSPTAEELAIIEDQFELAKKDIKSFDLVENILTKELLYDDEEKVYKILNRETRYMEKVDPATLRLLFPPKVLSGQIRDNTHVVRMQYNPNFKGIWGEKSEDSSFRLINVYRPASWHVDYFFSKVPVPKTDIPEIYVDYLKHLTNESELSFNYLINFMASCVQTDKKAFTYCTLLGSQGVGKGVLFHIIKELLGENNAVEIRANKLSEIRFNGFAKNKKLIFFDEVDIRNSADETALKFYVNKTMEIEEKGRDSKTYENYANIMLASNSLSNLRIESDDRRYSFVDLGDKKLDVFTKEKYNMDTDHYVNNMLLHPSNIKQLGEYLLNFEIDLNLISKPIKSEAKRNQNVNNLKDWEEIFLNSVCAHFQGKEISIRDVKERVKEESSNNKINPGRDTWKDLSRRFPGIFTRIKKTIGTDKKQEYYLKFNNIDQQNEAKLKLNLMKKTEQDSYED